MDRKVYRHDEVLLSADDELYEVGKGTIVAELDDELRGAKSGDILKFNAAVPGQGDVTFQILVKEVREKVLPDLTDEWAGEASEFETVAELRENLRAQADAVKRLQAAMAVSDKVVEALVELVDDEMPAALVGSETERRIEMLSHRLSHQGVDLDVFLGATGQTREDLLAHIQAEATSAVKADLALRYVAEAEGIEVTDDDVEAEMVTLAERSKVTPEAIRDRLESEGRLSEVRSGIRKSKALEWLAAHTEYVDEEGRVVDRSELEPVNPAAQDEQETPEMTRTTQGNQ